MIDIQLFNVLANNCNSNTCACTGVIGEHGIPGDLVSIIHYVYLAIQVIVPAVLIIFGMIELGKAITAQKEDEIKHAQSSFLKKLILAVIVFLVFSIVQLVFNFATSGSDDNKSIWSCVNSVVNGECTADNCAPPDDQNANDKPSNEGTSDNQSSNSHGGGGSSGRPGEHGGSSTGGRPR